uniref:SLX4 interacting protein n=1 Tax=Strigops habroptila TaxID=2489341 RepID=A0A672USZ9_STRHB
DVRRKFFTCGNFAVLVDVHILPQGSSKDTSWFSDHAKELDCLELFRIFHICGFEYGCNFCNLLFNSFYIDLRVFPDRFIVCVSKLDFNPSDWTCDSGVLVRTKLFYTFSGLQLKIKNKIPFHCSVKRTKLKKSSTSKPQISEDSKKVSLGSVDSQTGNRKNDHRTSLSPQSEVMRRSPGLLKDCTNIVESNLELPVLELENYVNQRQPDCVSSQQKPHSVEWLKATLWSENPPCSSETAVLAPKRSQEVTKTQAQQKSCAPEEKLEHFKKVSSEGTPFIPSNTEMSKYDDGCLGPFLEEKAPLNSGLFSKQDMTKAASDEESLTLRRNLSQPLSVKNNIAQTRQNEPSPTTEDGMPPPSIELQPVSSGKLSQKRKKEQFKTMKNNQNPK